MKNSSSEKVAQPPKSIIVTCDFGIVTLANILSRATCEGASQIRWHEDSIMGMVKGGASNLAGYTKPNPLHLIHKHTKIIWLII